MRNNNKVDSFFERLKNNKITYIIIIAGIIIISVATFTESLTKIANAIGGILQNNEVETIAIDSMQSGKDDVRPLGFNINDPNIKLLKILNLRKETGASISIGNCPDKPCFVIGFRGLDLAADPPIAIMAVGEHPDIVQTPSSKSMRIDVCLKRNSGFKLRTPNYDLIFEIRDSDINSLTAWVAIFEGTQSDGSMTFDGYGCD